MMPPSRDSWVSFQYMDVNGPYNVKKQTKSYKDSTTSISKPEVMAVVEDNKKIMTLFKV